MDENLLTSAQRDQRHRLKALRVRYGLKQSQLADRLGLGTSSVGNWERGDAMSPENLKELRRLFPDDLLPGDPNMEEVSRYYPQAFTLPFAGNVPASVWGDALNDSEPVIVDPVFVAPNRYKTRVVGDSCAPALLEGDEAIWEVTHDPEPGTLVLAQRKGDHGCTVKQLRFDSEGTPQLHPVNPRHDPPPDGEGWGVIAVLVGVKRKAAYGSRTFYDDGRALTPAILQT